MPKSRSRSRSKARTYTVLGNQTVDARSKQLLFNEFEICTMGRTVLKGNESFTEGVANTLLEKHMKKKKPVGYVNFLIDRMRFGKQSGSGSASNREYLTYREIKQLYTFLSRPNVFMLGVEEEGTGKRSYETYMCKNVDDLNRIQELIKQSTSDPQFLLRADNVLAHSVVPTPVPTEYPPRNSGIYTHNQPLERTSVINSRVSSRSEVCTQFSNHQYYQATHQQTSPIMFEPPLPKSSERYESPPPPRSVRQSRQITVRNSQPSRESEHIYSTRSYSPVFVQLQPQLREHRIASSSPQHANDDYLYRNSRVISVKHKPKPNVVIDKPRARSLSTEPEHLNTWWRDDLTYVVPNTSEGPEVSDRGSVFLYVSRTKHNDEAATASPDSIPVSMIQV